MQHAVVVGAFACFCMGLSTLNSTAQPTDCSGATHSETRRLESSVEAACAIDESRPRPILTGVSFSFENDYFTFADAHADYSYGLQLSLEVPGTIQLPFFRGDADCVESSSSECVSTTFLIGQKAYTPEDISISSYQPREHPYAGLLYVGWASSLTSETQMRSVSLHLGTTGQRAGAEWLQTRWHEIFDSTEPMGWQHQVKEMYWVTAIWDQKFVWYERTTPHGHLPLLVSPYYRLTAGSIHTILAGGLRARLAWNRRTRWEEGIESAKRKQWRFSVLVSSGIRLVGRNELLESATMSGIRMDYEIRRLVWELRARLKLEYKRLLVQYHLSWQSTEYAAGWDRYGGLLLGYVWSDRE